MDKKYIIAEGLKDWAAYFRRKLSPRVEKMYIDIFLPYSKQTIRLIFKNHIKFGEKFPFIHEVSTKLSQEEELFINYDKTEDQRFPVGKLWEGFSILEKHGKDAFYNFCNSVRMPLNDRQRVLGKFHCAYSTDKITKNLFKNTEKEIKWKEGYAGPPIPKEIIENERGQNEL